MVQDILSLLGCEDVQRIPEDIRAKISHVILFYQHSIENGGRNAAEAYEGTVCRLRKELDAAVQRRIELEMEVVKHKTLGDAGAGPAGGQGKTPHAVAPGGLRRENILLKAKLLASRRSIHGLSKSEKALNAQVEFLMGSVDKDRKELIRVMADYVSELSRYKSADREDAREEGGLNGDAHHERHRTLKTECERLKNNEGEYRADIFSKASEIFQLKKENSELLARTLVLDQYRANYVELHRDFVEKIVALKNLDMANAELRDVLAKREAFYSGYLLDMQIKEDFSEKLEEMGQLQLQSYKRYLEDCEAANAQKAHVNGELRGLKAILEGIAGPRDQPVGEDTEDVDLQGNDVKLLCFESDQIIFNRIPSKDLIVRSIEKIRWEMESVLCDVANISSVGGRIRECFHLCVGERMDNNDRGVPPGSLELESQMVKEENRILVEDCAYLKKNLAELSALHQSAKKELEKANADRTELLSEVERLSQAMESWRQNGDEGHAPDAAFDESYYKKYINDLEKQLESYKGDVRYIEEKFEQYKHLYESFDIQKSKDLIEELRAAVSKKDAYIEKQNLLLEKYRKLKEAFVQLKQAGN